MYQDAVTHMVLHTKSAYFAEQSSQHQQALPRTEAIGRAWDNTSTLNMPCMLSVFLAPSVTFFGF